MLIYMHEHEYKYKRRYPIGALTKSENIMQVQNSCIDHSDLLDLDFHLQCDLGQAEELEAQRLNLLGRMASDVEDISYHIDTDHGGFEPDYLALVCDHLDLR